MGTLLDARMMYPRPGAQTLLTGPPGLVGCKVRVRNLALWATNWDVVGTTTTGSGSEGEGTRGGGAAGLAGFLFGRLGFRMPACGVADQAEEP